MMKTYRLGALGFAHGHIYGLMRAFSQLPNVEWVACADTVPAVPTSLGRSEHAIARAQDVTGGIPKVYADYREMLDKETFDIVIFCPENARHGEVAEAIAAKGAHLVTEKPMADTLSGALRMVRAAKANNVALMVNWPTTWSPAVRKMKALIDQGVIGDVWEVKWRNGGSMGPLSYSQPEPPGAEKGTSWWHQNATGGGALLDYCCYGACLSRWYIGEQATAATGMRANLRSQYGDADDNAVITVRFPQALAILEGTWTSWNVGVSTGPIVYGSRGCMVATHKLGTGEEHPPQVVQLFTSRSHILIEPDQEFEGDPLPKGRATPAEEFIHHLETGEPLHPTLDMMKNLEIMAILDAGIRSTASGKVELVDNVTWRIG
jgi:predicted dehydrogenase